MTYSVWADGVRIGGTELELRPSPRRRTGALHPTEIGMAFLLAVTRPGSRRKLEVRDPAGIGIRCGSIAIIDVERLIAAACARRPGSATAAPEKFCGPVRFVISLTLDLNASDAAPESAATWPRASCFVG